MPSTIRLVSLIFCRVPVNSAAFAETDIRMIATVIAGRRIGFTPWNSTGRGRDAGETACIDRAILADIARSRYGSLQIAAIELFYRGMAEAAIAPDRSRSLPFKPAPGGRRVA